MNDRTAFINAIGTAVPDHDIHNAFVDWAAAGIADSRERAAFTRMARRSGITHRWSVLPQGEGGESPVGPGGFYADDVPGTGGRMRVYAEAAPPLALSAIEALAAKMPLGRITHLVVVSCTGFVAPGIDQMIAARLGLAADVERTLIGFMGCAAGVVGLRTARQIVRAEPGARVLVVTVELSTLHLQFGAGLEALLAMLQFGDGAAAALVTGDAEGIEIGRPFCAALPDSGEMIGWTIGDAGFVMHLSGQVPGRIAQALGEEAARRLLLEEGPPGAIDDWAVHAGGRSILDAVESGLGLDADALATSRNVLARYGNMSSATLLFVLAELLDAGAGAAGVAMAFGPGMSIEGFRFGRAR